MASWRFLLAGTALALAARADGPGLARYDRATVAPAKTSIYVGTVTLSLTPLERSGALYLSRYSARVFPYFFLDEAGRIQIEVPDGALRRLAAGSPISFTGRAVRDDGTLRRVDGTATPLGPGSGRIVFRVHLGRIVLAFDTTYRLAETEARVSSR